MSRDDFERKAQRKGTLAFVFWTLSMASLLAAVVLAAKR